MAKQNTRGMVRALKKLLPKQVVFSEPINRHSYARDAGFYRLLPQVVVKATNSDHVSMLFKFASAQKRKIVFRAGGTSLSGQAITDDILVEIRSGWRSMEILENGRSVTLEPGVIAAHANQRLAPLGYRIGPDPGSIRAACIGGIVANNASGIGSGTWANSYQTLRAMEMVLPNGLILNTADPMDDERLHHQAPEIYEGLLKLRARILENGPLLKRIKAKYKLKNTVGYGLNSFVDFDRPIEILAHLMVGSEGTLGFISKVTLETVPIQPLHATSFVRFTSLEDAAKLVPALKRLGLTACEILDGAALRAVELHWRNGEDVETILVPDEAALLLEFSGTDQEKLNDQVVKATEVIQLKHPNLKITFSEDTASRESLWKTRRELGPIHASARTPGTTLLSEDVCFNPKHLAKAIKDLQFLFKRYGYTDAVIFGHAGDGNLHFKLSLDLSSSRDIDKYSEFIEDLVTLVVEKYDGSLKAEHGTGRNMAPFVEREWGTEGYAIMKEVKRLIDPQGILNPDVIISQDPQIHLKNIKPIPLVDPIADACIECGLCEPNCPSTDLTLTPRQRIMVLREMEMLRWDHREADALASIQTAFQYEGIDTCAADGLCSLGCPVGIDTGMLIKKMRGQQRKSMGKRLGGWIQTHPLITQEMIRAGLHLMSPWRKLSAQPSMRETNRRINEWSGRRIPQWNPLLRSTKRLEKITQSSEPVDLVYIPSCINRMIHSGEDLTVPQAFQEILRQADLRASYPKSINDLCCGLTFHSKGFNDAALRSAIATTQALWESSRQGKLPIVMDTSPCTSHMQNYDQILTGTHLAHWRALKIVDMVEYLNDKVLSRLDIRQKTEARVVLHPTCSSIKKGTDITLEALARKCAKNVFRPAAEGCCGFAGDRGLYFPELTERASRSEAQNVKRLKGDRHYSTSRMCEVGMSQATGQEYSAIVFLVHEVMMAQDGFSKK